MKEQPLVSILVPVYGVERYIERCVRSLFGQTYQNLEFIFVDDCTQDGSMEIMKEVMLDYPQRKEQVRIFRHDHNRGVAAARNTALEHCMGDYLMFVDPDDWMDKSSVELLVRRLLETDSDIVTGRALDCQPEIGKFSLHDAEIDFKGLDRHHFLMSILAKKASTVLWGRIYRTSLYRDHGMRFYEGVDFSEDLTVLPKLFYYARKVTCVDTIVYYYNTGNNNSIVHRLYDNGSPELLLQGIRAYRIVADFFEDKESDYKECINKTRIIKFYSFLLLAASHHTHEGYNLIRDALDGTNPKYWPAIGWNVPLKRWMDRHYLLAACSIPLRRFHGWLYQLLHK